MKSHLNIQLFSFEELNELITEKSQELIEYFKLYFLYLLMITGRGLDFDRTREYAPGDDASRIDWKATARNADRTFVKLFDEERRRDIIVVFDVSTTMLTGTRELTKNQFASLVSGVLAYTGMDVGDAVGLLMYSSEVEVFLEPAYDDFYPLLKELTTPENYGGFKDWQGLGKYLLRNVYSDTILFVVSDFINSDIELFLSNAAGNFYKVYGLMVRDPTENSLPEGVGPVYLKDPTTGEAFLVNLDTAKEQFDKLSALERKRVGEIFANYGQVLLQFETGDSFINSFVRGLEESEELL